jgi:hypothetical protein
MQKLFSTLYKSVVRATGDLVKDVQTAVDDTAEYWDWENRADEDKLPRVTLIGVNGFHFKENNGLWIISFGITLSTVDDDNLLREADIIDMIHDRFGEKKKIALLDPVDASQTSELWSSDFEVMPMGQTQVRNYRPIGIELRRTGT